MQRISRLVLFTLLVTSTLLAACGAQAGGGSPAVQAVQAYLQALVAKDATKLSNLSCAAWESDATLEMDSFQAVTATLQGVSCQETGKNGSATLVNCNGAIVATYNNEKQNLDLSPRTYKVVQEGGEWRVCGYQ
jgi:predicted small secreted protein